MHLIIPLKTLKSMVDALKDNIPKSPHQEVLSNFLLVAKNDLLTMTVTDLRLWIIRREDCPNIKTEGAIALNAKRFTDTVKSLAGEDVEIKVSGASAVIKCGKSKFNLPVISEANYPSPPKSDEAKTFTVSTEIMKSGIAATLKTVSDDPTKPILMGVNIREYDETLEDEDEPTHFLEFISTDAKRGSLYRVAIAPLAGLNNTIPTRTLKEIEHITQNEIEVQCTGNYIWFITRSLTIISPFVDGKYAPVRTMMPTLKGQDKTGSVKCDRKELVKSLGTVASLCGGDIHEYTTDIAIEQDEMVFVSQVKGAGTVEERLPCDVSALGFESRFNIKYLQHILDTIKSKYVKLEAYSGRQPCVLIYPCDGTDHETFLMAAPKPKKFTEVDNDEED